MIINFELRAANKAAAIEAFAERLDAEIAESEATADAGIVAAAKEAAALAIAQIDDPADHIDAGFAVGEQQVLVKGGLALTVRGQHPDHPGEELVDSVSLRIEAGIYRKG